MNLQEDDSCVLGSKLSTYLPLPVDSDKGDAKFDSKRELLMVTLPILLDEL
jgi:hypothetical protein